MRRPQDLKKSPTCLDKTIVFSSVASKQVGGIFFQIFVAFSEKLNFICTFVTDSLSFFFHYYAEITFFKLYENVLSMYSFRSPVFFMQYMKFVGLLSMKPLDMIHSDTSA